MTKKLTSSDVKQLANQYTELAIKTLADICMDFEAGAGARAAAAAALLDRAHGKPGQEIALTGQGGGPLLVAGLDIASLSTEKLNALREILGGARELPALPEPRETKPDVE